jgi:membrane protease YdiL (CAAX protease family)
LNVPTAVRCRGCGVLNASDGRDCKACGTRLPPVVVAAVASGAASGITPDVAPAQPTTTSASDEIGAAAQAQARVAGVARLFVALLALWIVATIAIKLGAPEVEVDLAQSVAFAGVALICVVAARADLAPLLVRTGGWRGGVAALAGFGFLVVFGAVYFPTLRWLGFPLERVTDAYLALGWPRWTPYALVSLVPGFFEELTFRGYVMARLDRLLTPRETLLVQAALFSLMHLGVVIFPSHFVIGLVLGMVRRRTASLYPGMAIHMAWNATVVWSELAGGSFP